MTGTAKTLFNLHPEAYTIHLFEATHKDGTQTGVKIFYYSRIVKMSGDNERSIILGTRRGLV